jgi:Flp pilus assembly protein protease CpaA
MQPFASALVAEVSLPGFLGHPETLVFLIPIAAIIVGGIIAIAKLLVRHRERMAMIEQGMDPDRPGSTDDK